MFSNVLISLSLVLLLIPSFLVHASNSDEEMVITFPPSPRDLRSLECKVFPRLAIVRLRPDETVILSAPTEFTETDWKCEIRMMTCWDYSISLDCSEVNLLGDQEIVVKSSFWFSDEFVAPFTYSTNSRRLKMFVHSPSSEMNSINGSFECTAKSTPISTAISSTPVTSAPTSPGITTTSVTSPNVGSTQPSSDCRCGIRDSNRIVGGENADEFEHPWIVSLGGDRTFCGGTLVTTTKIVTAAHCVGNSNFIVHLGQYNRGDSHDYTVTRSVRNIERHPQYNSRTLDYDIAVITIDEVPLSNAVNPACLPETTRDYAGDLVTVAGWGTTSSGGNQPQVLQEVNVDVLTQTVCSSRYPFSITSRMMCAGVNEGGKDSCQGDSGGPLTFYDTASGATELIGIVSWGSGCAVARFPGVYTRVTELMPWILEEIGGESQLCPRP